MQSNFKKIAVFTSGGDSPGMNAALFSIAKTCELNNIELIGILKGYKGMISGDFVTLNANDLQNKLHLGGTILKTARSEDFFTSKGREKALLNLKKEKVDGLIAIGGDGTMNGIIAFSEISDIPAIGIPGTIDNDLQGSDYTLGFDSAVNTAIENIDRIRDTAESHNRIFIIEVMGRDSGYIGVYSGISTGADGILVPETKKDTQILLKKLAKFNGEEAFIIVTSEGDEIPLDDLTSMISNVKSDLEIRVSQLGHIQRGGKPSASDRILGIRLGNASVRGLLENKTLTMVGIKNNQISYTPLKSVIKTHDLSEELKNLLELISN